MFKSIKKRNGQTVPFKIEKVANAIYKASVAVGNPNWQLKIILDDNISYSVSILIK